MSDKLSNAVFVLKLIPKSGKRKVSKRVAISEFTRDGAIVEAKKEWEKESKVRKEATLYARVKGELVAFHRFYWSNGKLSEEAVG
jgi:hypothetical protein